MLNSICFPEDIYNNRAFESKTISIDSEFYKSFLNLNNVIGFKKKNIKATLYKNKKDLNEIIRTMSKNHFEIDKIRSVVKTLGSDANAFSYKKTTNLEKQETGDLTTAFNNDDKAHDKLNKFQNIGIKLH